MKLFKLFAVLSLLLFSLAAFGATAPQSSIQVTNNGSVAIVINTQSIAVNGSYTWTGANLSLVASDLVFRTCALAGSVAVVINGQGITQSTAMTSPVFSQLLDDMISGDVTLVN